MSSTLEYLANRGLGNHSPSELNRALQIVLETMAPEAHETEASGLTATEQAVLRRVGGRLEATSGADPLADGVAKYAALVTASASSAEVAKMLGVSAGRVRQMLADRSLFSFVINRKRYIPLYQFEAGRLIGNIGQINQALPEAHHPVAVFNWYHSPNPDLVEGAEDAEWTPIDWLRVGQDLGVLLAAASHL